MAARGLTVVALDGPTVDLWRRESEAVYGKLDCHLEHPELFAKVLELKRARGDR
jgi:hypothetical protein